MRGINDVSTNRLKFANSLGIRFPFKLQPLKTSLSPLFSLGSYENQKERYSVTYYDIPILMLIDLTRVASNSQLITKIQVRTMGT